MPYNFHDYSPSKPSSKKSSSNRPNPHTKSGSSKKSKSYKAPGTLSDPREKDDSAAKVDLFHEKGATNIENLKMIGAGTVLKPVFKAGSRSTRKFFTDKVLTSERGLKNLGYTKEEFSKLNTTKQEEVYKKYLAGRQDNTIDAYGNPYTGGGDAPASVVEPIATKQKVGTDIAKKQEEIVLTKKQQLAKASGSGHGTKSTIMTSMVGDEEEANVAQTSLGGTIMRKKKKYG